MGIYRGLMHFCIFFEPTNAIQRITRTDPRFMKVTEHISKANGKTLFSIEILPPLKGRSMNDIYQAIDPLLDYNPSFIDVTYHREEYVYKKRQDGLLKKNQLRNAPALQQIALPS